MSPCIEKLILSTMASTLILLKALHGEVTFNSLLCALCNDLLGQRQVGAMFLHACVPFHEGLLRYEDCVVRCTGASLGV